MVLIMIMLSQLKTRPGGLLLFVGGASTKPSTESILLCGNGVWASRSLIIHLVICVVLRFLF